MALGDLICWELMRRFFVATCRQICIVVEIWVSRLLSRAGFFVSIAMVLCEYSASFCLV